MYASEQHAFWNVHKYEEQYDLLATKICVNKSSEDAIFLKLRNFPSFDRDNIKYNFPSVSLDFPSTSVGLDFLSDFCDKASHSPEIICCRADVGYFRKWPSFDADGNLYLPLRWSMPVVGQIPCPQAPWADKAVGNANHHLENND